MDATRLIFWNTNGRELMYFFALISFAFFFLGVSMKVGGWLQGRPSGYHDLRLRYKTFFSDVIKHDKGIFKGIFRRFMHLGIFYGFVILSIGTLVIAVQDHFGIPIYYGKTYLILTFLMDLFGILAMLGIGMAAYKRYIDKPDHEDYTFDDAFLLILIFSILFTGFILEALRIYITHDPSAWWSPAGFLLSSAIKVSGLSVISALSMHVFLWYFHMLLAFGFIAYIPYSKLFHMFASALNLFLKSSSSIGGLNSVDKLSEGVRNLGAAHLEDFTKKQLLELDACISCGRCQKGCPATISGAPLSPSVVIRDLKKYSKGKQSFLKSKVSDFNPSIIDTVIAQETLWACTTCGLCEDKCPIKIEHIKRIVDMRRSVNAEDPGYPLEIKKACTNIAEVGNCWGLSIDSKYYLANDSHVPILSKNKQTDILYWVGCYGTYESRNKKVSQVMFKLLERAGVDYAILGSEEKCCGDSVRRVGNEKLFQKLAVENVKNLNRYGLKTIVTHCPHCYNTLKNDYPQFGGHYRVIHHSELILELINSGKLKPKGTNELNVTFHDPCYLGRYNSIYNAPRDVLTSIPGLELVEMKNNRARAFCCGAGGGRIWMEDIKEHRINSLLVKKALRTESDILVSACPLCLTTLTEAISRSDGSIEGKDIAEIVYDAL